MEHSGHSGLPYYAVNSLLLGYEATLELMRRFHETYKTHPKEQDHGFTRSSPSVPDWPSADLPPVLHDEADGALAHPGRH